MSNITHSMEKISGKTYKNERYMASERYVEQEISNKIRQDDNRNNRRKQRQVSQISKQISLQNRLMNAQQQNKNQQNTILMMQQNIERLQKVNEELLRQSKKHNYELSQFATKAKRNLQQKQKRIIQLQQLIKQLQNNKNAEDSIYQSFQSLNFDRQLLTKSVQLGNFPPIQNIVRNQNIQMKQLKDENQSLRNLLDQANIEIQELKKQNSLIKIGIQALNNIKQEQMQKNNTNLLFYEKIIQQKQQTIRKMSQFNNQMCIKFIHNSYSQENSKNDGFNNQQLRKKHQKQYLQKITQLEEQIQSYLKIQQNMQKNIQKLTSENQQYLRTQKNLVEIIQKQKIQISDRKHDSKYRKNSQISSGNNIQFQILQNSRLQNHIDDLQIKSQFQHQKLTRQVYYWKNKSKSLWKLLKNIEDQNLLNQKTIDIDEGPKFNLLHKSTILTNKTKPYDLIDLRQKGSYNEKLNDKSIFKKDQFQQTLTDEEQNLQQLILFSDKKYQSFQDDISQKIEFKSRVSVQDEEKLNEGWIKPNKPSRNSQQNRHFKTFDCFHQKKFNHEMRTRIQSKIN